MPHDVPEDVPALVERALAEGPFTMQQVAHESGISYDSLYSWTKRRRVPRADTLRRLAAGFEARANRIWGIANELRGAADKLDVAGGN